MEVMSNNQRLLDFTECNANALSPNDIASLYSPTSMDSGFSGSDLNFMSPRNETNAFDLQYQQSQDEFSPLKIQITSPGNRNGFSPASETSSSSVQYMNLNDVNMYSPANNFENRHQQQTVYMFSPVPVIGSPNKYMFQQAEMGQAKLEVLEQPSREFRFRYKSEMNGPHGNLMGMRSSKTEKTYPTVALKNYHSTSPTKIRCSLYQISGNSRRLHSHKLVIKSGECEKSDPHDFPINDKQNYIVKCEGMGIIRNPRPQIKAELCRKKTIEFEFEENRKPNIEEMVRIEKESEEEAKTMNLNQVCLKFDALRYNDQLQKWERVCEPTYSNVINDTKSAKTGQLKICRMSKDVSFASGGDEIFIFVEKVCKDNIKVRFFEGDEDDRTWVADGIFDETDVHHQFGIVLKTPKYKDETILAPVQVFIELYRPSDGCVSNPLPFKYKPNPRSENTRKRARRDSADIPTVVHERSMEMPNKNVEATQNPSGNDASLFGGQYFETKPSVNEDQQLALEASIIFADFGDINDMLKSEDFDPSFIEDPDIFNFSQFGLATDSVANNDNISRVLDKIKLLERIFKNDYEEQKMKTLIGELIEKQTNSNNILFDAIESIEFTKIQELALILFKYKFVDILFDNTENGENSLHLCVKSKKTKLIKFFSRIGVDANQGNSDGNTPLHFAAIEDNFEAVEELIKYQDEKVKKSILKFDSLNDDGYSALHIAAQNQNLNVVKALINAGASIDVKNPRTGNNILQTSIESNDCSSELVKYLVEYDEDLVTEKNGSGFDALDLANVKKISENIIDIMKKSIKDPALLLSKLAIKEAADSDFDKDQAEIEQSKVDIREASLIVWPEKDENPSSIELFDNECLEQMRLVLDKGEKWQQIAMLMGFENFTADWIDKESPTISMLKHIECKNKSIDDLVSFLEMLDERAAINLIDEMIVRKMQR